jgi:hypothetical protein
MFGSHTRAIPFERQPSSAPAQGAIGVPLSTLELTVDLPTLPDSEDTADAQVC